MENCVTFNIGKITVNAKTNQQELTFNEHRKICHENNNFSFEYGTIMDSNKISLHGHSLKTEKHLENYKFIVHIYINNKLMEEKQIIYKDVIDLYTNEDQSNLLKTIIKNIKQSNNVNLKLENSQKNTINPKKMQKKIL